MLQPMTIIAAVVGVWDEFDDSPSSSAWYGIYCEGDFGPCAKADGQAGPPPCISQCPGLSAVTTKPQLYCFAKAIANHPCKATCDSGVLNMLDRSAAQCITGGAPAPVPAPAPAPITVPNLPQCSRFQQSASPRSFSTTTLSVQGWTVAGLNGPPACVSDCPGLSTVVDQPTLACFASCAVAHPCTQDCDQATRSMLASRQAPCDSSNNGGTPPAAAPPAPPGPGPAP